MQVFGVDLDDNNAVLNKMRELQTKAAEVSHLSNLWSEHQDAKKSKGSRQEQPPMQAAA